MNGKPDCVPIGPRTMDSARDCQCDACTRWWCDNVDGYFYCPLCKDACLTAMGRYNIDDVGLVCETCFDLWWEEHDD